MDDISEELKQLQEDGYTLANAAKTADELKAKCEELLKFDDDLNT